MLKQQRTTSGSHSRLRLKDKAPFLFETKKKKKIILLTFFVLPKKKELLGKSDSSLAPFSLWNVALPCYHVNNEHQRLMLTLKFLTREA